MEQHERLVLHVDMDCFFAAVEQRDHPEFKGKPVIVGGLSARGVVSTASYEARAYGVRSAMPMALAKRKCPAGIFLQGSYRQYGAVSAQIFEILSRFSPLIEPLSIDEGFLDLTGMEHLIKGNPRAYGLKLKETILAETGLVASVGIAPNKFLAKLASDLEKPDGLVIIRLEDIQRILWPLPVSRIWGVGKKTEARLSQLGYRCISDIAKARPEVLQRQVGERLANHLVELANGRDDRPVEAPREAQSIGKETTFEEDLHSGEEAEHHLLSLASQVGWRLRRSGRKAHTVQIKIRLSDFSTYPRQRKLGEAICYDEDIFREARNLFRAFRLPVGSGIRLLGVSCSGFNAPSEISLFSMEENRKKESLYSAIDKIKAKFGEDKIGHLGEAGKVTSIERKGRIRHVFQKQEEKSICD